MFFLAPLQGCTTFIVVSRADALGFILPPRWGEEIGGVRGAGMKMRMKMKKIRIGDREQGNGEP